MPNLSLCVVFLFGANAQLENTLASAHSFYHNIASILSTPGWVGTDARITVVEGASNFSTFVTKMSTPVIASAWAGTFYCGT